MSEHAAQNRAYLGDELQYIFGKKKGHHNTLTARFRGVVGYHVSLTHVECALKVSGVSSSPHHCREDSDHVCAQLPSP